ncbi:MAG: TonB-dependent receptor [Phenylobacterium sp.]|uniref:TonB-dependent receptor n=1 Tax=Phenylobacterium sp. TaxID=1871053 RepID=UPI0025FE8D33|nr:TonB-dependent receptor plug domain-containing protein [Phenylobacterium sp.]MBI1198597.1 TonB-dependent receptor [Phenylobacterium sp.]
MHKMIWLGAVSAIALGVATGADAQTAANGGSVSTVDELIVTAQKREERLVDVPAAVTALQGDALQEIGAKTLADYAALVPGLQFASQGGGVGQQLVLRGLATGVQTDSALVGEIIDGIPVGSSSTYALGGASALDSSLWDVDRVEVLRGPQGTLYGASGMSGLISFIYNKPDLRSFGGALEAEAAATEHGEATYVVRGLVNVPIVEDQLALRVTAFGDREGGYLDDPTRGEKDINRRTSEGVRGNLLWRPNDRFEASLIGIYQLNRREASDAAAYLATTQKPVRGSLDQLHSLLDPAKFVYDLAALNMSYDFGPVTLTSTSSYQYLKNDRITYFTDTTTAPLFTSPGFLALVGVAGPPATNVLFNFRNHTSKLTEELKVTSNGDGPLQYVAGFYTAHEKSDGNSLFIGTDAGGTPLANMNPGVDAGIPSVYKEYAGYAQASYTWDRLTVTGGLRYTSIDQTFQQTLAGPYRAGLLALRILGTTGKISGTQHETNYLVNARFALTPRSNLYARVADGFRPGGPNVVVVGLPASFKADRLTDYEAGYKGAFLDGRLQFDANVFYIKWDDIQLRASVNGITGETNGGAASSRGAEAQTTFRPIPGLTLGGNIAYAKAKLDEDVPSVGGEAGDPLPLSAKWSGAVFGSYVFPLSGEWSGFVGGTARANSARNVSFPNAAAKGLPNYRLPSYVLADVRAGVQNDRYTATVFINNIGDSRAQISALATDVAVTGAGQVALARPRTVGVRLDAVF